MLEQDEIDHLQTLQEEAGVDASYLREGDGEFPLTVVPVKPTPGRLVFGDYQLYDTATVFVVGKRDFLGKNLFKNPGAGDRIRFVLADKELEFLVEALNGAPCWLDSGNYGVMMRICTRAYRQ